MTATGTITSAEMETQRKRIIQILNCKVSISNGTAVC